MWETGSWDRACHKRTCPWPESKPDPSVQGPIFHPRSPTSQDFRGDVMNSAERCLHRQSCHAPGAGVPRPCRGQGNGGPALMGLRTCPPQPARPGQATAARPTGSRSGGLRGTTSSRRPLRPASCPTAAALLMPTQPPAMTRLRGKPPGLAQRQPCNPRNPGRCRDH